MSGTLCLIAMRTLITWMDHARDLLQRSPSRRFCKKVSPSAASRIMSSPQATLSAFAEMDEHIEHGAWKENDDSLSYI